VLASQRPSESQPFKHRGEPAFAPSADFREPISQGDPLMSSATDPFSTQDTFETGQGPATIYRLDRLGAAGLGDVSRLPYSIRMLLESALRNCDGFKVTEQDVRNVASWGPDTAGKVEIAFMPARVVLQDFTGVPTLVDLAAMRTAMSRLGGDPKKVNPLIPVDLVIDHSVQVDRFNSPTALFQNVEIEFERNNERYEFLKWGQKAFDNFRVVPPSVGIVHQVNLEYLAQGVFLRKDADGNTVAVPDTLVGTDSHTTMINGLGVVGWGVGGIEAEAVMLGQPIYMLLPEVVGFELTGSLPPGATATDLVLTVTQMLRKFGVVNKFVEFHGTGVATMTVADRATIANMAPEYGATMGFFPVDEATLAYYRMTGRSPETVELVERYCKEQGLFFTPDAPVPNFTAHLKLDMSSVTPSMAGPKRPQDRVPLSEMKQSFEASLRAPLADRGFALDDEAMKRTGKVQDNGHTTDITHGAVVIAAITSCTNTSNPMVMLAAGLLAKNAVARGLKVPSYVKTSLSPGSRVVTDYLDKAGLSESLDKIGFYTTGYGCMTCIGNSGPLPESVATAVTEGNLVASAVLSGNRNFEGRINPLTKANYLASPPLVVAYALAGTTKIDLLNEPIGHDQDGKPVMLEEIWPTLDEVRQVVEKCVTSEMFRERYGNVFEGPEDWRKIPIAGGELYAWNEASTYIQEPPFFLDLKPEVAPIEPILKARCLAVLGDSVTTDHISPAGSIKTDSPAGSYLVAQGVRPIDFNSYGSRRGNDRVMTRGTFANVRLRNLMAPGTEGGWTRHMPSGQQMTIYEASRKYIEDGVPLVILAGAEYGTGSSRDWAAKGTLLLGVRAVIATSFERIHRSNLVGMGILPLQFLTGETWETLGLTGAETFDFPDIGEDLRPRSKLKVTATTDAGKTTEFTVDVRIDTEVELEYYRNGGILQTVLRKMMLN
jgi:aconitate hydratase